MSTYPGNSSLSSAVKERVLSTFQQTLALFKQGRADEVVQGCGLILRMDPMFDPAKKLMEKAKNPASPINVDSLLIIQPSGDPVSEARAAMAQRNFQRALDITTELLTQDLMNEDARVLNEKAREKMEAQPFIEQFVKKINQSMASGNYPSARADLEKIRSLDAEHPALAKLEQSIGREAQQAPVGSSSAFVVDSPPSASGRGTAQASDFGFTFEEDKPAQQPPAAGFGGDAFSPFSTDTGTAAPPPPPGGFSFDSPAPPPAAPSAGFSFDAPAPPAASSPFSSGFSFDTPGAAPAATPGPGNEFDFSTASVATTAEDQAKVQQYLADGDAAFDAGDFQQAIDIWSRIFLIDVTNEDASSRIERAKSKRHDSEQQVEGLLASAIQLFDHNDKAAARDRFLEVLHVDPNNSTAHDYLERINTSTPARPPTVEKPIPSASADVFADESDLLEPPPIAPPAPIPRPAIPSPGAAPKKAAPAVKRGLPLPLPAILGIGLVLLVGIGWFAWTKFSKPSVDPAATAAIFSQADTFAKKGQFDAAIAILQDVKPDDPQHDKALSLIADLQHKKAQGSDLIDGRPAAAVFNESLATGKAAYEAHDYDSAKKAFDTASRIKALPPDMKSLSDIASQQVAKLDNAKTLFKEQRYAEALSNLQPLALQDPQNASVKRMITDAHFNIGATALLEERLSDAIREFDEVLKADPNDDLAKRSKALAEKYNNQPKDLLYKIYVKYLPTRKVS